MIPLKYPIKNRKSLFVAQNAFKEILNNTRPPQDLDRAKKILARAYNIKF
jgi:hypothetical protein